MVSQTICADPRPEFLPRWPRPRRTEFRSRPFRQQPSLVPFRTVAAFASRGRRFSAPFLAHIVVVEKRTLGTDDPAAMVAIGPEAVLADQRADTSLLELDRIEGIQARRLDLELRSGIAVEQ